MTLLFPLNYLRLENESGRYLIWRDSLSWLVITLLLSVPFSAIEGSNYFHKDGFLDKFASFSSVLTGFYVAALIAVATLSSKFADLDEPITDGEVRKPQLDNEEPELLSRRQYVCYMFGYMAYLSLILSLVSIALVVLSPMFHQISLTVCDRVIPHAFFRGSAIFLLSIPIASLAITTIRGLYYLVERLYAESAKIIQPSAED